MARLPDRHLNLYELALLASEEAPRNSPAGFSAPERRELEEHVRVCAECQELLEQEQFLFRMLERAPMRDTPGEGCPSPEQWMELVAGLESPLHAQKQIEHARNCSSCCAQLKNISEHFADEISEDEYRVRESLASASPEWQRNLARRMQATSSRENSPRTAKTAWSRRPYVRFGIPAFGAVLFFLLVAWFAYLRPSRDINQLLSLAYSEHRTTDLRMIGSSYAAVEAFRGGENSEFRPPTALLEAEVMISKRLAAQPDDPRWLDAQGRADLIEGNYSNALSSLERAHRYKPEDELIMIDLASSYFLRGEMLKRSEDYGRAVDLFGRVLSSNPQSEVARFNRAIASERLLLYEQAVEDWKRYLEIDPHSTWSVEARKRLQDIQEKIDLQKKQASRPLLAPSEFSSALQKHDQKSIAALDDRVERYFELALTQWIPRAFSDPSENDEAGTREALEGLAQMLISKHQDYWLSDFLGELRHNPRSRRALYPLAVTLRSNAAADFADGRKSAIDATRLFRTMGNRPGELLAQFESSYSDQLAHQVSDCLAEARPRDAAGALGRYPWLRIQLDLESAACANLNDQTARQLASEALSLAKLYRYPCLELRATVFLTELYQYMGDLSTAWRYATVGLSRYWDGDYPAVRGYSLYVELDYIAESAEEWFLDSQVLVEESAFDRDDPDVEVHALGNYRIANALAMIGDLPGAERNVNEGHELFLRSANSIRKKNLEFEAQVALAKAEVLCSRPQAAIQRLQPLAPQAHSLDDQDLAFDYFQNLGLAYMAVGESVRANQELTDAISLAEQSLEANHDERERLMWCRKVDRAYRSLVQLRLADSAAAFSQWEWFKGASVRGSPLRSARPIEQLLSHEPPRVEQFEPLPDTVLVSYAVLPSQTVAWTFSREGLRQYLLSFSEKDIELLAHRFADHCSRPNSNVATIAEESRLLYAKLVEPIENSFHGYNHLVIEPDRALWLIPFAALLDGRSVYFGDRYAVSLSPGLSYLRLSPSWQNVTDRSPILIAGDPVNIGREPLEDAEQEAKGIARQFRFKRLLLGGDAGYGHIAEEMRDSEIFHFSGHAIASPDGVGLLLGDSVVMDATRIRSSDVRHLRLVVLSACNSANGTDGVFDDRNSLARLLVGAGVTEVVASHWTVDSRAAKILMEEFYAQLLSGAEVSSALGEASRRLRANREFRHPFYWASFSAFGKS